MKPLLVLVILGLIAVDASLWHRVDVLEGPPADYPLGETMGYFQRCADKIWYAAQAGNWDLAQYYHDEIAETAADIENAHVNKEGVDVSKTLQLMLPPVVEGVNQAIQAKNLQLFDQRYRTMVETCSACHVAAKHPFIHIAVPQGPPTQWNQDFSNSPAAQ